MMEKSLMKCDPGQRWFQVYMLTSLNQTLHDESVLTYHQWDYKEPMKIFDG